MSDAPHNLELLSIQDAAKEMGKSRAYVQYLVTHDWNGKCQKIGGGDLRVGFWLIPRELIEAWKQSRLSKTSTKGADANDH